MRGPLRPRRLHIQCSCILVGLVEPVSSSAGRCHLSFLNEYFDSWRYLHRHHIQSAVLAVVVLVRWVARLVVLLSPLLTYLVPICLVLFVSLLSEIFCARALRLRFARVLVILVLSVA